MPIDPSPDKRATGVPENITPPGGANDPTPWNSER